MRIYPVILCGGSGTRLWPASRPARPKQFITLTSERSLFQDTAARLRGLDRAQALIVVAGERHIDTIARQLAQVGIEATIIAEPEGRDSAPAIAAAAAWIARTDPAGIAVVAASDHHIPDAGAFSASVAIGAPAAARGRIVAFGVKPTSPATAYGYIQPGAPLDDAPGAYRIARFVEKPDEATARACVEAGYLWNSGNFALGAQTLLDELSRHAPQVAEQATRAVAQAVIDGPVVRLGPAFLAAPTISIDYALMEKTERAAVAPAAFAWSDLGAWGAVWSASARDEAGNAVRGDAVLLDSHECLVRAEGGGLVIGVGLNRLAIVTEADAVLVCDLDSSQKVKVAVEGLRAAGRREADFAAHPAQSLAALRDELTLWLRTSALPLWWTAGADHVRGGFHEQLDDRAAPVAKARRARVQARQVYSYALAHELGWPGPWRQAADHGLDYLLRHYRRDDGLFRASVEPSGAPADETAPLYDQAFVLFALAAVARIAPDRAGALGSLAETVLAALKPTPGAGYIEAAGPTPYQANPHMHLLEAALAWEDAGGGRAWSDLADGLVELCLTRFIDAQTGVLREFFDRDWRPLGGVDGRIVEPGHQFEWCWLLERWGRSRARPDACAAARRLYQVGTLGIDGARAVVVNALLDDLSVHDAGTRLWPQTEWLKASLILRDGGEGTGGAGYEAGAVAAAGALKRHLNGVTPGLWRDKQDATGAFRREPAPASSLYHITCAIAELERGA
jgi:mannose-1-phosphate guanylyltransferase/mannose-6-phosphate isomerase